MRTRARERRLALFDAKKLEEAIFGDEIGESATIKLGSVVEWRNLSESTPRRLDLRERASARTHKIADELPLAVKDELAKKKNVVRVVAVYETRFALEAHL